MQPAAVHGSSRLHVAGTAERHLTLLTNMQSPLGKAVRMWLLYKTWIGRLLLCLPLTWWILA
jgi:hypothetical protein